MEVVGLRASIQNKVSLAPEWVNGLGDRLIDFNQLHSSKIMMWALRPEPSSSWRRSFSGQNGDGN